MLEIIWVICWISCNRFKSLISLHVTGQLLITPGFDEEKISCSFIWFHFIEISKPHSTTHIVWRLMSVQPFNSRNSLCISRIFPHLSRFLIWETLLSVHNVTLWRVSQNSDTHVYKPKALEGFLSGVLVGLGIEGPFHQLLPS
jgi:hypothetical protein